MNRMIHGVMWLTACIVVCASIGGCKSVPPQPAKETGSEVAEAPRDVAPDDESSMEEAAEDDGGFAPVPKETPEQGEQPQPGDMFAFHDDAAVADMPGAREETVAWESFEPEHWWTVEAADGPAKLRVLGDHATAGKAVLRVEIIPSHRGKAQIRREVRLDLTQMSKLVLDVFANIDGFSVALALHAAGGGAYYESAPVALSKGDNKDVTFELDVPKFKKSGGYDQLIKGREDVRRVALIFGEQGTKGVVFLDNLRFVGVPSDGWEMREPRDLMVTARSPVVRKYEPVVLDVRFDATYAEYFNPGDVNITATFVAPNGDRFRAYGFLADFVVGPDGRERPEWLVRYTPTRAGRWEYVVKIRNKLGEIRSPAQYFDCREAEGNPGFIRRSRRDPQYFEFDAGEFYYPIGQNVCWANDYESYFAKMSANGENCVRIWMCPWHLRLEPADQMGAYDLATAKRLDEILELAARHGIYVVLVSQYHGMLNRSSWDENPYNKVNGGPCAQPGDFFTNGEARSYFKRRLRYMASRWGCYTSLFAWELWNEVDLTAHHSADDLVRWHNEMSRYLKSQDAQRHLVTTSSYSEKVGEQLWRLAGIDFIQAHRYTHKIVPFVVASAENMQRFRKPFFIGEFGRGWQAATDQKDPKGANLHAGLWASFMTPSAGSAMVWWWDTFVEHQDLYFHWKALSAFAEGEDRRGADFRQVRTTLKLPDRKRLEVLGLLSNSRGMFWFYENNAVTLTDEPENDETPTVTGLHLGGMFDGDYDVEFWDTYDGRIVSTFKTIAKGGRLTVQLPQMERDMACKIRFTGETVPGVLATVEPEDEKAEEAASPKPSAK